MKSLKRCASALENEAESRTLARVRTRGGGDVINVPKDTEVEAFWKLLPEEANDLIQDLEFSGRDGVQTAEVEGLGAVETWIDASSEGSDRGGYVRFAKLLGVLDSTGQPIVLEEDNPADGFFIFEGRMSVSP